MRSLQGKLMRMRFTRRSRRLMFLLAVLAIGTSLLHSKSREERWQRDLEVIAKKLPKKHPNLYHTVSKEDFETAIRDLRVRIPKLADHEILVGMAHILARVGDGHTNLSLLREETGFHVYPLRFYLYDEGLFVSSAIAYHKKAVGAKVLKVGNADTEQALEAVKQIISADNEMSYKLFGPIYLRSPEILHALGLIDSVESCTYIVQSAQGEVFVVKPRALTLAQVRGIDFLNWTEAQGREDTRLLLQHPGELYWFEYLEDRRAIFMQFNQVQNAKEESFSKFCKRLFRFIDENRVKRLIIDLRWNGGGDGKLNEPLIRGLASRPLGNERGRLLVLIGRGTYSAAATTALLLEKETEAIFVGEPIRSQPNHYGETKWLKLPESKVRLSTSSVFGRLAGVEDDRAWLPPDLPTAHSIQDARSGIDRALETALNYPESGGE